MLFSDKLTDIIKTLESDGLLLHAEDLGWNIACSPFSDIAIDKIYNLTNRDPNEGLELLVEDLSMFKKVIPYLHPRVETLLYYHRKPLSVVCPNADVFLPSILDRNGAATIRIINDQYCKKIINLLDTPLVSVSAANVHANRPETYTDIKEKILNACDFRATHNRNKTYHVKPAVKIEYDSEGELIFQE